MANKNNTVDPLRFLDVSNPKQVAASPNENVLSQPEISKLPQSSGNSLLNSPKNENYNSFIALPNNDLINIEKKLLTPLNPVKNVPITIIRTEMNKSKRRQIPQTSKTTIMQPQFTPVHGIPATQAYPNAIINFKNQPNHTPQRWVGPEHYQNFDANLNRLIQKTCQAKLPHYVATYLSQQAEQQKAMIETQLLDNLASSPLKSLAPVGVPVSTNPISPIKTVEVSVHQNGQPGKYSKFSERKTPTVLNLVPTRFHQVSSGKTGKVMQNICNENNRKRVGTKKIKNNLNNQKLVKRKVSKGKENENIIINDTVCTPLGQQSETRSTDTIPSSKHCISCKEKNIQNEVYRKALAKKQDSITEYELNSIKQREEINQIRSALEHRILEKKDLEKKFLDTWKDNENNFTDLIAARTEIGMLKRENSALMEKIKLLSHQPNNLTNTCNDSISPENTDTREKEARILQLEAKLKQQNFHYSSRNLALSIIKACKNDFEDASIPKNSSERNILKSRISKLSENDDLEKCLQNRLVEVVRDFANGSDKINKKLKEFKNSNTAMAEQIQAKNERINEMRKEKYLLENQIVKLETKITKNKSRKNIGSSKSVISKSDEDGQLGFLSQSSQSDIETEVTLECRMASELGKAGVERPETPIEYVIGTKTGLQVSSVISPKRSRHASAVKASDPPRVQQVQENLVSDNNNFNIDEVSPKNEPELKASSTKMITRSQKKSLTSTPNKPRYKTGSRLRKDSFKTKQQIIEDDKQKKTLEKHHGIAADQKPKRVAHKPVVFNPVIPNMMKEKNINHETEIGTQLKKENMINEKVLENCIIRSRSNTISSKSSRDSFYLDNFVSRFTDRLSSTKIVISQCF